LGGGELWWWGRGIMIMGLHALHGCPSAPAATSTHNTQYIRNHICLPIALSPAAALGGHSPTSHTTTTTTNTHISLPPQGLTYLGPRRP
jgi:hypothetical protein